MPWWPSSAAAGRWRSGSPPTGRGPRASRNWSPAVAIWAESPVKSSPIAILLAAWAPRATGAPSWRQSGSISGGVLSVVPRACRPYRAQTKGKVERMVRELKESFLPWLSGQILPSKPTIADYDEIGRRWIDEVVLTRRHRTTGRIVGEAWAEERPLLTPITPPLLGGGARR